MKIKIYCGVYVDYCCHAPPPPPPPSLFSQFGGGGRDNSNQRKHHNKSLFFRLLQGPMVHSLSGIHLKLPTIWNSVHFFTIRYDGSSAKEQVRNYFFYFHDALLVEPADMLNTDII